MRNSKGQFIKGHNIGHGSKSLETRAKISKTVSANLVRYWLGKHIPEEARRKMSLAKKGKVGNRKGQLVSIATRLKMRLARLGRYSGSNHPQWKGGVSRDMHSGGLYKGFTKKVFERDRYKCRRCGGMGFLHAHHIKNFSEYPDLRYILNNGVTLCVSCHRSFHKAYGSRHNTIQQINYFLTNSVDLVGVN